MGTIRDGGPKCETQDLTPLQMKIDTIIDSVVRLPMEYNGPRNNKSIYSLLQDTSYFEAYDQVSVDDISKSLSKNPKCVDAWLNWSESKRSCSGWYFRKENQCEYVVGYFPETDMHRTTRYSNIKQACSEFIKREIEEIRKMKG